MKTFLLWFFEPKCVNTPKPKNTPGNKMSKILQGAECGNTSKLYTSEEKKIYIFLTTEKSVIIYKITNF